MKFQLPAKMRLGVGAAAVAALSLVSACGTRVNLASSGVAQQGDAFALADTPAATSDLGLGTSPLQNSSTTSGVPGVTPATNDVARAGGVESNSSQVPNVSGAKPSALVVGVVTSGNVGAYAGALGMAANFGDQRAQAQLVANYVNSHGGIANHPVSLTFYDYSAGQDAATNAQAACAAFTQDHHAFAGIGIAGMDDSYHACAAKRSMFVIADADRKGASFFKRYPTTILVGEANLTRKYYALAYALKANNYFTKNAKVGILYSDEANEIEGVNLGLKPAMAELGIKVSGEYAVSNDATAYTSQISGAALKMRSDGITHVIFAGPSALTFGQAAQNQGYRPAFGLDSRQSPALVLQGALSPDTLAATVGLGYLPLLDVDAAHDPGPVSANATLCKNLFVKAGQWPSSRLTQAAALYICDELFFLHAVFKGHSGVTRSDFLNGIAAIGDSYQSTWTFATRYSATQHEGAYIYRPFKFSRACNCFIYSAPKALMKTKN